MANLSRDYTAATMWREAVRDLNATGVLSFEKYNLVNRTIQTVAGQFYDLMSNSYMTEATATIAGTAKYETVTGGTYTSATRTVTMNNPSAALSSADIEKVVMFRIDSNIYLGTIESVTSSSAFVFKIHVPYSGAYPAADSTTDEILICGTTLSGSTVSLSSLRIMRTGQQIKLEVATTATATIKAGTMREVDTFVGSGRNSKTIVWALKGDSIDFAIGDDLTNAGTLTIRYPRVPVQVEADSDKVDLPDGTAIEIAIIYLRSLLQRRLKLPPEDNEGELRRLINDLYKTFGAEASTEIVTEKILALK
jgi:hypothetical protein